MVKLFDSKFNIYIPDRKDVNIKINKNGKIIEINGEWCAAWWGIGQFYIEYWINTYEEMSY